MRQLMVESLVLSIAGTVLAIVLAWWAVQVLRDLDARGVPRVAAIALDLRVLGAAAGCSRSSPACCSASSRRCSCRGPI